MWVSKLTAVNMTPLGWLGHKNLNTNIYCMNVQTNLGLPHSHMHKGLFVCDVVQMTLNRFNSLRKLSIAINKCSACLVKNSDDTLWNIFPWKKGLMFQSNCLHKGDNLHEMSNPVFWKKSKILSNGHLLNLLQWVKDQTGGTRKHKYAINEKAKTHASLHNHDNEVHQGPHWFSIQYQKYRIRPNYCTVRLDFSKLLKKLAVKYQPNKGTL